MQSDHLSNASAQSKMIILVSENEFGQEASIMCVWLRLRRLVTFCGTVYKLCYLLTYLVSISFHFVSAVAAL